MAIANFRHRVIVIKITQEFIEKRGSVYEAVRKAWRISPKNANEAEYILAVRDGVIIDVFSLTGEWRESYIPGRYEFEGQPAPSNIQNLYINKELPPEYREQGASNPIRYSWDVYKKRGKK